MNLNEIIKYKFGSVDKMIEQTNLSISRAYLYQILNGNKQNLTLQVMEELKDALGLETLDEVRNIIQVKEEYTNVEEVQ